MRARFKLRRPGHGTVVAYLALFIALGGSAYAASHLGSKTVGTKQLKGGAVTAAKLKKNAVTRAKIKNGAVDGSKIKNGAVDGSKIADGSVTGADINAQTMPFSQIVHEARGNSTVTLPTGAKTAYPLNNATYTQDPGRDDFYAGELDVTIPPSCTGNRIVYGQLTVDAADPAKAGSPEVVASGEFYAPGSGQASGRISLGPTYNGVRFQSASPINHTLGIAASASCTTGGGVTATFGGVDVIGVK
jgi:hypothetical protein